MNIGVDNTTAECFANGTAKRSKIKHVDQRLRFVKAMRDKEIVNVYHVPTKENIADIMTKPLERQSFENIRGKLMVNFPIVSQHFVSCIFPYTFSSL